MHDHPKARSRRSRQINTNDRRQSFWPLLTLGAVGMAGGYFAAQAMQQRSETASHPKDTAPDHTKKGLGANKVLELGNTITIARPRAEVFEFWQDVARWPEVMTSVVAAERLSDDRWRLRFADENDGVEMSITEHVADERIAWSTAEDASFQGDGVVTFRDAPADRGTEVTAKISWRPPGGAAGRMIARLFAIQPEVQGRREMKRLKMFLETGEVATAKNRKSETERLNS